MSPLPFGDTLPPNIAYQLTIASYLAVASCGVLIWDILDNIQGEYRLLTRYRIRFPTVVYFISRLGTLGYVLTTTMFDTMSIPGGCSRFLQIVSAFMTISISTTCLLFFLRLRAIFNRSLLISAIFILLWVVLLGSCITFFFGASASYIGSTGYCVMSRLEDYVASAAIAPLIYDTLVFGAITWRLTVDTHTADVDTSPRNPGVTAVIRGQFLPAFTRAILQDGQICYLVTSVFVCFTTVVILYIPDLPKTYRTMFGPPDVVLGNIMACRVFRKTKFGHFRETSGLSNMTVLREMETKARSMAVPIQFRSIDSTGSSRRNCEDVEHSSPGSENPTNAGVEKVPVSC